MKKKILSIIVIVISFLLMYGSITTIENTITSAQDRVVDLKFQETEIVEEMPEGENPEGETAEVEEETNSYNKKELAIIITSSVILSASFILIIYATMVFFGGIKNINSLYLVLCVVLCSIYSIIRYAINKKGNIFIVSITVCSKICNNSCIPFLLQNSP